MNWKPSDMYDGAIKILSRAIDDKILEKLNMEAMNVEFTVSNEDQKAIVKTGKDFIDLILRKNSNYGSSVFKRPILTPGLSVDAAIRVRMSDKIERLQALSDGQADLVGEAIEDTIKDLGAYCLLWLINHSKHNSLESQPDDC